MMNASVSDEREHLPLMGTLVIQGLLFTLGLRIPHDAESAASAVRRADRISRSALRARDPRQANSARHARHSNDFELSRGNDEHEDDDRSANHGVGIRDWRGVGIGDAARARAGPARACRRFARCVYQQARNRGARRQRFRARHGSQFGGRPGPPELHDHRASRRSLVAQPAQSLGLLGVQLQPRRHPDDQQDDRLRRSDVRDQHRGEY